MKMRTQESGFTMIETLVAITVFAIVSVGFYSVMFAGTRASNTVEEVARVTEEARLGFNRLIRETREGQLFNQLQDSSYEVLIDFDGDGVYNNPNASGDYEHLDFKYVAGDRTIYLNNQPLIEGVERVGTDAGGSVPANAPQIFSYVSNDLRYDWDGDGIATKEELDLAPGKGYLDISGDKIDLYSSVLFQFQVRVGRQVTVFQGQAQLRNYRT